MAEGEETWKESYNDDISGRQWRSAGRPDQLYIMDEIRYTEFNAKHSTDIKWKYGIELGRVWHTDFQSIEH